MKCLKNPRFKYRQEIKVLTRAFELNMGHLGILLYAAHVVSAGTFPYTKCRDFYIEYLQAVEEYGEDDEYRDYYVRQGLKNAPWLSFEKCLGLVDMFAKKATEPLDKLLYSESGWRNQFARDVLFMLIMLHESMSIGRVRTERMVSTINALGYPEPIGWLKGIGIELVTDDDSAYKAIKGMKKQRPQTTLREQIDARRELEALKAYQEEIRK